MDRIRRDTLLGLVFFGTLAFLLWATVNLTDLAFGEVLEREVQFNDGGGAQVGTNVLVLGKKVGKVSAIAIDYANEQAPVTMRLRLQEPVPFTDKTLIEVRADGVLGGKVVYIDPGRGEPIPAAAVLRGKTQQSLFTRLGEIADGKGALGESILETVIAIGDAARALQDERNTMGRLFTRTDLHDEVMQTVGRLNQILEVIQTGQSTFGRLAVDTAMGERVQAIVDNLAQASAALTGTEGTVGMLLNDPDTAADVRAIASEVADIIAGVRQQKGIVGRLLFDEALADRFANSLLGLDELLKKANDPNAGLVGAILGDPQTAQDIKIALANLRDVTDSLTRSDSALGLLINDKDVGVRLRRIFTQVSRALEDAREAAPISSFVQVMLGVF